MDDRVCMHYVIDRLEDILEEDPIDTSKLILKTYEFKRELIYNLGINQRIAYGEDNEDILTSHRSKRNGNALGPTIIY